MDPRSKSFCLKVPAAAAILVVGVLAVGGCKKSAPTSAPVPAAPAPVPAPAPAAPPPAAAVSEAAPAAATVPKGDVEHKLIWIPQAEPGQAYEVLQTQPAHANVAPDTFKRWCQPFDPAAYTIHQKREIAKGGVFQEEPNWWVRPPYNLPALSDAWLQVMGGDSWFYYEVEAR